MKAPINWRLQHYAIIAYRGIMETNKQTFYRLLGLNLKECREALGYTQTEASIMLNKPQSYISRIELGEKQVTVLELVVFSKKYMTSISELMPKGWEEK